MSEEHFQSRRGWHTDAKMQRCRQPIDANACFFDAVVSCDYINVFLENIFVIHFLQLRKPLGRLTWVVPSGEAVHIDAAGGKYSRALPSALDDSMVPAPGFLCIAKCRPSNLGLYKYIYICLYTLHIYTCLLEFVRFDTCTMDNVFLAKLGMCSNIWLVL